MKISLEGGEREGGGERGEGRGRERGGDGVCGLEGGRERKVKEKTLQLVA